VPFKIFKGVNVIVPEVVTVIIFSVELLETSDNYRLELKTIGDVLALGGTYIDIYFYY